MSRAERGRSSSITTAQRKAILDRKFRGQLNAHVGSLSAIIDIGCGVTKVMVAGDLAPRLLLVTPTAVSNVMDTAVTEDELYPHVAPFIHRLVAEASLGNAVNTTIVLLNVARNRVFEKCVTELFTSYSPLQRIRPLCTQVAAMLAHGCNSGLVLDIGMRSTRCVPVIQDIGAKFEAAFSTRGTFSIVDALRRQIMDEHREIIEYRLAGQLTDELLMDVLIRFGSTPPPKDTPGLSEEARSDIVRAKYPLVVKTLTVYARPNKAIDRLFQEHPDSESGNKSLQRTVITALKNCDPTTLRRDAAASVVPVGGFTALPNFRRRFAAEVLRAMRADSDPSIKTLASTIRMPELPSNISPGIAAVFGAAVLATSK